MSTLWRKMSSRARRMLAEDPRFFALALLVLALGLGVHAGLFEAVNGSRFGARSWTTPNRVVTASDQVWDASGGALLALEPAGSSDAAISAFVRRLAASSTGSETKPACAAHRRRHNPRRIKTAWLTHRRNARRMRVAWITHLRTVQRLKSAWIVNPPLAQPGDAPAIITWTEIVPPAAEPGMGMTPPAAIALSPVEAERAPDPAPEPAIAAAPTSPARCPLAPRRNHQ